MGFITILKKHRVRENKSNNNKWPSNSTTHNNIM